MTNRIKRYLPNHFQIYFGLLVAMAVSLPLSKALMSIFPGFLMANWIFEGQFGIKLNRLKERKSLLLLISIFFIYLIGMMWTPSFKWGIHDVKIQLPLLVLPLVIGTSESLNRTQVKTIVYFFSGAVIIASLCSIYVLLGFSGKTIHDPRQLSLFISHIRFALLINIGIFSLGWFLFSGPKKKLPELLFLATSVVWLSLFLVILKSATGWVVFIAVFTVTVFSSILKIKIPAIKFSLFALLLILFLTPFFYIGYVARQFYKVDPVPENINSEKTRQGHSYSHDLNNKQLENGHYIFLYFNDDELREEWNKRSKIKYDSISPSGFNKFVLFRYITSKGLRKDADGVNALSATDVHNIENGMTNYRFANPFSFYNRVYQILWEADNYRKGGNPSGHSVTQRLEYYKMAFLIIEEKFWFGQGTGGYYPAYQAKYDQNPFFKGQQYRQRSHNMFLSYWIDFGLIGLIYICYALVAPVFLEKRQNNFLLVVFLFIVFLSFLNEDTLNNHDAISFFAFFYPLYLYNSLIPNSSPKGKGVRPEKN